MEAVAPSDAVMVTSWVGCDVGGTRGCIGPCEGAYEDHEDDPLLGVHHTPGVQNYFGHRDPNPGTRPRTEAGSYVSPFDGDYRTRLELLPFLIGGCLLNL